MAAPTKPEYKVIGTRPVRPDGIDKVTGRAQYGADIRQARMIYGKVLRSPHAHANIKRIDTSKAEALEGVKAVVTGADLPQSGDRRSDKSLNVLAADKALYRGHAIAAVAATNPYIADEALKLIEVEYEVLPPVLDVREAMRPDAPVVLDWVRTTSMAGTGEEPTNVAAKGGFNFGDADKGFEECDEIVEGEFKTKMVHQGYIEPQACTAMWNPDGQLTVWTSTQGSFPVRNDTSEILDIPISKVKVVPTEIGGGFGGKIPVYIEPTAALLSKKSGRPVALRLDRTNVFEGTGPTSGTSIKAKIGATKDGKLVAAYADMAYEAGCFPGSSVTLGAMAMFAPYDIEHVKIDTYDVVVNKPHVQDYRAPGAPAAGFAIEQLVDELAEKLHIDPLKLKQMNSSHEGTRGPGGMPFSRIGQEECVEAAMNSEHYKSPLEGPNRGRGVASGFWFNVGLRSSVNISVQPDGTVNLVEGNTDIGGTRASLAMQLAETLGIAYEDVKPMVVDTDAVGYNDVTAGSRTTYATGMAVNKAGLNLIEKMKGLLAAKWSAEPDAVEFASGTFSSGENSASFREAAGIVAGPADATLNATGEVSAGVLVGGGFSTHIVDVEVDPDTGKTQILRYTVVQDAGTAIHPSYVEGQMQGGAVQGIGWALNEEYYYDEEGKMANASFLDYRLPTTLDLPMIETVIVEVPNPTHPFGVRGVGEVSIVPPLGAIANAVYRATGVRQFELPMSPRRVLETTHDLG